MTHKIKIEDFENYKIKTVTASSSAENKYLYAITDMVKNNITYVIEYNKKEFRFVNLVDAIEAYNKCA